MKQVLKSIKITSFNRGKVSCSNKVGNIIDIIEDIEIAELTSKSVHNTFSQSRAEIQSTQNRSKLIKFSDKSGKTIEYEDVIASMTNIPVIKDNNCLIFKNNIEYV